MSKINDKARVLHHIIINKKILHKAGSKDSVSQAHEFLLVHFLTYKEINLPSFLFATFFKMSKERERKLSFPLVSL